MDEAFADPEIATNSARLNELSRQRQEMQEELDGLYEEWETFA